MRYGIEVEVENMVQDHKQPKSTVTSDGSLRNGCEYVSSILKDKEVARKWYATLLRGIKKCGGTFGERTSTHIHMDFTMSTLKDVKDFIKKYVMFERYLQEFSGLSRKQSNFCVALLDCSSRLKKIFSATSRIERTSSMWNKYTALNLTRLGDLGTVEFRMLGGGIDVEALEHILNLMEDIRYLNEQELLEKYKEILNQKDILEAKAFNISTFGIPVKKGEDDSAKANFFEKHFAKLLEKKPKQPKTTTLSKDAVIEAMHELGLL